MSDVKIMDKLIHYCSDVISYRRWNDTPSEIRKEISNELGVELSKEYHAYNGDPEEFDGSDDISHVDWILLIAMWNRIKNNQKSLEQELSEANGLLGEAVAHLKITTHVSEYAFDTGNAPPKGLDITFYHTLSYDGDVKEIDKIKRAREFLNKSKIDKLLNKEEK